MQLLINSSVRRHCGRRPPPGVLDAASAHLVQGERGFTLAELLVTAAVLVAVSGISFPTLASFYEGQKLRQAAIELQSHLLRARALAQRQRSTCNLSISSGATVQVTGSGACATLPTLNLTAEVGVRGLCIRDTDGGPSPCTAPAAINFLSLGVLQGSGQTLFLAGTATSAQACVNLSLTLIRVGYRQATSGACTYSGS